MWHIPTGSAREIAVQAGLSKRTVDRVLNNRGQVRESTAREVHQAIADLDREWVRGWGWLAAPLRSSAL